MVIEKGIDPEFNFISNRGMQDHHKNLKKGKSEKASIHIILRPHTWSMQKES